MMRRLQPPLLVSLRRSQIASLTATAVDFTTLVFLVEVGNIWYVAATAVGAFLGAVVNFVLGRQWSFMAEHGPIGGQAVRYAAVAAVSLGLNSLGVYLFTEYFGIHYAVSRVLTALLVGILFNFPLHRTFVFRKQNYAS